MKFKNLPTTIRRSLTKRGISEEHAEAMSPKEIFEEHCNWHGLIDWGGELFDLSIELQEMSEKFPA